MFKKYVIIVGIFLCFSVQAESGMILKVSVMASNKVLLNGKKIKPADLVQALLFAQERNGQIWYFRENPASPPPPVAKKVIVLLLQSQLPISMSTKPDFSNYIDAHGKLKPRF